MTECQEKLGTEKEMGGGNRGKIKDCHSLLLKGSNMTYKGHEKDDETG